MNEKQKQAFNDQILLLPKAFQDAISESKWEERVINVGEKAGLYLDQTDELISEVALVLSGLIEEIDFRKRVVDRLMIDYDKADELIRALNHEVFEPLEASVRAKTENKDLQFTSKTIGVPTQVQAPSVQQFTTGVFKVAPEKYSVKTLDTQKPSGDPYREPIE